MSNFGLGLNLKTIGLSAAAIFLGPLIVTAAGGILRSVAKAGIKSGYMLAEKGKELMEETKGSLEDVYEEAKSEVSQERKAKAKKGQP